MSNRRIEPVWLAQSFFDDFVLVYPVYAIMMLEHGVGELDLGVLFVIWSASSLVFEIPSGVLGDLYDRRVYIFVGCLVRAGGYLAWWLMPTTPGFALGFILWSLGSAIHSGTLESLLFDALSAQGRVADFARIYGRGKAAHGLGVLAAMALGGYVAETGYTSVLLLSAAAPVVTGLIVLGGMSEPPRTLATEAKSASFLDTLTTAGRALLGNPRLRRVSVVYVVLIGTYGTIDEFPGALLDQTSRAEGAALSLGAIGLLYGAFVGAEAIGSAVAHRLQFLGHAQIGVASVIAHAVLLAALAAGVLMAWPVGVVLLTGGCATYFALMGVVSVLLESSLQHEIDVGARATVTSFAGAALEVWGILAYLVIGATAAAHSWAAALAVAAGIAVVISMCVFYTAGPRAARNRS
ncbi:MAG: MFS transporter [Pseudomonadales bacterium]